MPAFRRRARAARDRPPPPAEPPAADTGAPKAAPLPEADLSRLEAEARYHRERLSLYRARLHGGKPTSPGRLRELEKTSAAADARLREARRP